VVLVKWILGAAGGGFIVLRIASCAEGILAAPRN
jgi:hypothetical protein